MSIDPKRLDGVMGDIWILTVLVWLIGGITCIAFMDYTIAPNGSSNFRQFFANNLFPYSLYLDAGLIALSILTVIGQDSIERATRREKVRQRWLRRYAHRTVRSRPIA